MERTFKEIFLSKWVPALITAIVGGIVVAIVIPKYQANYAEESALKKRKIELWESIGDNFTNYITYRGRLNSAALSEIKLRSSNQIIPRRFLDRKESYRVERDKYATQLRRDFLLADYYYDNQVEIIIKSFQEWHGQYKDKTVEQLPSDEEYYKWRDRIMLGIRENLTKK